MSAAWIIAIAVIVVMVAVSVPVFIHADRTIRRINRHLDGMEQRSRDFWRAREESGKP